MFDFVLIRLIEDKNVPIIAPLPPPIVNASGDQMELNVHIRTGEAGTSRLFHVVVDAIPELLN
jgi:hypothetical protein